MYESRLQKVKEESKRRGLDALIVTSWENLYYLLGVLPLHSAERLSYPSMPLFLNCKDNDKEIFCPVATFAKLTREEHEYIKDVRPHSGKQFAPLSQVVSQIIEEWNLTSGTIGLERKYASAFVVDLIRNQLPKTKFKDCSDLVQKVRMIKDETEKACCIKACQITTRVLESAKDFLKAGKTEMDVAKDITRSIIENGGDERASFHPQVFSGERGLLQSITSSRKKEIRNGEIVLLDFGAAYKGYRCDTTRPFVIGRATKEQKESAEAIKNIIKGTVESLRPGIKASDVRNTVLSKYAEQGYPCLEDGTGHGMGLETWEPPFLNSLDDTILQPDMFLAVENTISRSKYGIRYEENVFVTKTGCEDYIKFPMELVEV